MDALTQQRVDCPYCGESIDVLIDTQDAGQQYIEDCQVCCRPIVFHLSISVDGSLSLSVHDENDGFQAG